MNATVGLTPTTATSTTAFGTVVGGHADAWIEPSVVLGDPNDVAGMITNNNNNHNHNDGGHFPNHQFWWTVAAQFLLFAMTLGLSATVEMKKLRQCLSNTTAIGYGIVLQYVLMPLLGAGTVILLQRQPSPPQSPHATMDLGTPLPPVAAVILLVLTSSPGGSYSTWWCATFNADLALSVALTTLSSLLGIVLLPANLWFWTRVVTRMDSLTASATHPDATNSHDGAEDVMTVSTTADEDGLLERLQMGTLLRSLMIVICAIGIGLAAGSVWDTERFRQSANRWGNLAGLGLVVLGLIMGSGGSTPAVNSDGHAHEASDDEDWIIGTGNAEANGDPASSTPATALWNQPWSLYLGVAMPCILGLALPTLCLARSRKLSKPEVVAIAIEVCYQNNGIATSVAISMFHASYERAQALAVPIMYGVTEATLIFLYCLWAWQAGWTKAPPCESLWNVLTKSFEGEHEHDDHDLDCVVVEEIECTVPSPSTANVMRWTKESRQGYSPVNAAEELDLTAGTTASCLPDASSTGNLCHVRKAIDFCEEKDRTCLAADTQGNVV